MSNRIATAFNPANTRRCVNAARRLRRWPTFQQHWLNFSCSLEKNPKFWITQGWCCCCRASFRGGQEKEDQSPQIDTFRCSEWSFFWKLGLYYMYTASLGRRDGKGSGFMWWRVLRQAHLAVPTVCIFSYEYLSETAKSKCAMKLIIGECAR